MATRVRRWLLAALAALAIAMVLAATALFFSGYRAFAITTLSMGTTYPVGTLVVTQPQSEYQVGDPITFTVRERVYTHRISGTLAEGFTTRGDLNDADDAWIVPQHDVVGAVVWSVRGLGWAVHALPWLLIAFVLIEVGVRMIRHRVRWRWPLRLMGWSITILTLALLLRPWFNVQLLSWVPNASGGVTMNLVGTGLLPMLAEGERVELGEAVTVNLSKPVADGVFVLRPQPDLELWQWCIVAALCLLPLVFSIRLQRRYAAPKVTMRSPRMVWARFGVVTAVSVVTTVTVVGALGFTSQAALTAKISNSTNTAGARAYFTCRDALSTTPGGYAAYSLQTTSSLKDLTGNNRTGSPVGAGKATSSRVGCNRDDPRLSMTFNGNDTCVKVPGPISSPNTFSLAVWFRTTAKPSGKLIGFGEDETVGTGSGLDRHAYLDGSGRMVLGVYYPGTFVTVTSTANLADGNWHHMVGVATPTTLALYIDGKLVGSTSFTGTMQSYSGYWRVGCGGLGRWPDANGVRPATANWPNWFTGDAQYAAFYTTALTAGQAKDHYLAGAP